MFSSVIYKDIIRRYKIRSVQGIEDFQVCYDIENVKAKEREVRALLKASKELKCKNLFVITEDKESYEEVSWFGSRKK